MRCGGRGKGKTIFEYLVDELSTWITEDQLWISLSPVLFAEFKGNQRGEKQRHQDMYTEIRSETHHSANTDDNTTPAILTMRSKATKATRSACRDSNHLPQANTRAPSRQPRPLVALSPHLRLTTRSPRLIIDVGRLSSIIATNTPGEPLGTRVRQQRRYQLLSIKNCPSNVVSNALRSGWCDVQSWVQTAIDLRTPSFTD
jgi:hypothetical protein